MAWDSHLRGYTGITLRQPGEAPRTFKNNQDFLKWQHEQNYKGQINKHDPEAARVSAAHRMNNTEKGCKGKGVAEPTEQANIDEEEELHDLFMSAPDEITWSSGNNEVVEGEKVDSEDLRSKVDMASPGGGDNIDDNDGLHGLFMSEPDEITWYSQANEAVEETPPTGKRKHTSTPFCAPPKPPSRVSRLLSPNSPDFLCPPTSHHIFFFLLQLFN